MLTSHCFDPVLEHLRLVVQELGPDTPGVTLIVEAESGDGWLIEWFDGTCIEAEFDADHERVCLSMQFPAPPADSRAAVFELLLAFNLLWQEEPVIRMAADPEAGDVVMLAELPARDLRVQQLGAALEKFRSTAGRWRAAIVDGLPAAATEGGLRHVPESLLA